MSHDYDVVIVGAGPAGTTCALALKDTALRVLLLERHAFPRDKVCGDAIPHRAVRTLEKVAPHALASLRTFPHAHRTHGCRVVAPGGKVVDLDFTLEGYTCTRTNFDHFLFRQLHGLQNIHAETGVPVTSVARTGEGIHVETGNGQVTTRMVIGCDGAHSVVRRLSGPDPMDPQHHSAAVRCYYHHIAGLEPGRMEFHLFRQLPAAYFWIFPLGDHAANVGIGMLSARIAATKTRLYECLSRVTGKSFLGARFASATPLDRPRGFGLPMGSRRVPLSGDGFLLCGDAASLIDPATGEGIGNAMHSGMLAARQAMACYKKNDFSSAFNRHYDQAVHDSLGPELRRKYLLQRVLANRPWLADVAVAAAARSPMLRRQMQHLF